MDKQLEEMLKIDGVEKCPLPSHADSVLCRTSAALVEICKKMGFFLWADEEDGLHRHGSTVPVGSETLLLLSMALPFPEDAFIGAVNRGIAPRPSPLWVSEDLFTQLNEEIKDDRSAIRRISTWPIDRAFVYFDVSDFSKEKAAKEVFIINSLIRVATDNRYWPGGYMAVAKNDLEASLCIGDGYIFVFKQVWCAVFFAGHLACLLEYLLAKDKLPVEFHFRVGVHVGPVYCFWDMGRGANGDWNYIGDGINGGQRVLAAIGKGTDDVVFVSGEAREALQRESHPTGHPARAILHGLHNRGRRADKHQEFWRVYELNHTNAVGGYLQYLSFN